MAQRKDFAQFNLDGDSDHENDEDAPHTFQRKKTCILFCVDARKKMFSANKEEESPFLQSIKCVRAAIRNKIVSSWRCSCGIILLGTDGKDNHLNLNNLYVVQPVKEVAADHMMKLNEIIAAVEDSSYEQKWGHASFNLGDVFWLSERIFSDKFSNAFKTILLFTNDDDPHELNVVEKRRVMMAASDMALNAVTLDLVPLGESFDVNKFYKEVLQLSRNDMTYKVPEPVTDLASMEERVIGNKHSSHVSMVKLPFVISDTFTCAVSVHYPVRETDMPYKVKLSKETNERVITKREMFQAETGEKVDKANLEKVFTVGTEEIPMKMSELEEPKAMEFRCLRLMGFKPDSTIRLEHYVQPCAFIYPDDSRVKGSSVFFAALLKRCLERKVVAICTFFPRPRSSVRFVALSPQDEVLAEDKSQLRPPGFIVVFLPYAEEVRDVDSKCCGRKRAGPGQVDLARKVVKKLRFNYEPKCFNNPKIITHWANIEALALNLPEPEPIADNTVPNYDGMSQRLGDLSQRFMEELFPDGYVPMEPMGRPKKVNAPVDFGAVEDSFRNGRAQGLTVDKLRGYLQAVVPGTLGLSKMKKAELLEVVSNQLGIPV